MKWNHGIQSPKFHTFRGQKIDRGRRISLIFRDALPNTPSLNIHYSS